MTATFKKFKADARKVIANPELQRSIENNTVAKMARRNQMAADFPRFEELRDQLKEVRSAVLSNLAEHLQTFEKNAIAAGAQVHWAADGAQANKIIADICKAHHATRVVKGKSMASEETHLNHYLEEQGIHPVETDLGEWIIQQAGDMPAHIITPAAHLNRYKIAELFKEATGVSIPGDDVEGLTALARKTLRKIFLESEVGITGGNVAVAETGSITLVMNEGNGRMSSSLPPVLIMLIGIEKVMPTWNEASVLLELLARCATGQPLSVYTTIVTGPARPDEGEGPREVHYVLLDNGRSNLIGTKYEEILQCIRCGSCLNVCPVYRKVGGHTYSTPISGPIGAVFSPLIFGLDKYEALPHASTLCGECTKYCPARIDFPRMLLELRNDEVEQRVLPWNETFIERFAAFVLAHPALYHLAGGLGRFFQWPVIKDGAFNLPVWINPARERKLPALPKRSFSDIWKKGDLK